MSASSDIAARIAQKKKVHSVQTDEGTLYVRGMNGTERNDYFNNITSESSDKERLVANQKLIVMQLCDEQGAATFTDVEEGMKVVLQWDIPEYVKPVVDAILKASGLGDGAADTAEKK